MDGILLRRKVLPNHSMRKNTSRERGGVAPHFVSGREIGGHVSECHVERVTNASRDCCGMRPPTGVTDCGQPCSQKAQLMSALNKWRRHLRGSEAAKSPPRKEGTFGFLDRIGPRAQ